MDVSSTECAGKLQLTLTALGATVITPSTRGIVRAFYNSVGLHTCTHPCHLSLHGEIGEVIINAAFLKLIYSPQLEAWISGYCESPHNFHNCRATHWTSVTLLVQLHCACQTSTHMTTSATKTCCPEVLHFLGPSHD